MCSTLCPEILIAVRVGTRPEVMLSECSEENTKGIPLSLLLPLPGFQNRYFSNMEGKTD